MDVLPVEILLEIGKTNLATYRGMLNIPKFTRAVTIGYRLDMMVKSEYAYDKILNSHRGRVATMKRCADSQIFTRCVHVVYAWETYLSVVKPFITIEDIHHGSNVIYDSYNGASYYNNQKYTDEGTRFYSMMSSRFTGIQSVSYFGYVRQI